MAAADACRWKPRKLAGRRAGRSSRGRRVAGGWIVDKRPVPGRCRRRMERREHNRAGMQAVDCGASEVAAFVLSVMLMAKVPGAQGRF